MALPHLDRILMVLALLMTGSLATLPAQRAPEWRATPDRTVTADDAGLGQIAQLIVLPSGELAVLDGKDNQIRFIGPVSAKPARTFGRDGEGPGEFRNLRWIGMRGGVVWAEDPTLKRITYLDATYTLARTVREPTTLVFGKGDTVQFAAGFVQGIAPDGALIMLALRGVRQPKPSWATDAQWEGMPYLRVGADGKILSVFAWVPAIACSPHIPTARGFAQFNIPFCARPLSAIATDGATIAVVGPDQAAHSYRVWSMKSSGDTAFAKQFTYTPVPVARARVDSALARADSTLKRQGVSTPAYHQPDSYPPLDNLLVGRDGTVWLGEYLHGATRTWHVLDRAGALIGNVVLPGNVTVAAAERRQLWGIARDSDGNESIVHYALAAEGVSR